MRRHLYILFLLLLCIAFPLQPAMDVLGAQQPAVAKKTVTTTQKTTAKKPAPATTAKTPAKVAAPTKAAQKAPPKNQAAKAPQSAKQPTVAAKQVGKKSQPVASSRTAVVAKKTTVVKRTTAAPAGARKKASARRPTLTRKKPCATATAVDQAGLPDIAKQISSRSVMVMDAGTGGVIFATGKPITAASTYLASNWAIPELDMDGVVCDCWRYADATPGWHSGTVWPAEALAILNA